MAKRLRDALKSRGLELSRSTALEVAAAELGHDSWNVASVKLEDDPHISLLAPIYETRLAWTRSPLGL
jgi:hypothetical protein